MRMLLLLVALWLPTLATAQPEPPMMISGEGANSCGSFVVAAERFGPRAAMRYNGDIYASEAARKTEWVSGFLAGVFLAARKQVPTDFDGIAIWVRRYCEQNPSMLLVAAALEFAKEHGVCVPANAPRCRR